MNFEPDDEERAWRDRMREFADHYSWDDIRAIREDVHTLGSDRYSFKFLADLAENNWIGLSFPAPYGQGASRMGAFLFREELDCAGLPAYGLDSNENPVEMLMRAGSPEQIDEHLPKIMDGTWRYAGGLSEPDAGSDLLALRTRAVREGDEYVINGSKMWTSGAHLADWIITIVRTDPESTRHRGLSVLLVPTTSPGLSIQPIPVMGGWRVNACFFDNVRVPAANRVGEENDGWTVLTGNLNDERSMSFGGTETRGLLARAIDRLGQSSDSLSQSQLIELGRLITESESDRLLHLRVAAVAARGEPTAAVGPINKLSGSTLAQRFAQWAVDNLGPETMYPVAAGTQATDQLAADLEEQLRVATVLTIIGGTSEIQRNMVAQRGLGLPRGG